MKSLLIGLLTLVSFASFASEIKLSNLPEATLEVSTPRNGSSDDVENMNSRHEQLKKETLLKLSDYVRNELNRQIVTKSCKAQSPGATEYKMIYENNIFSYSEEYKTAAVRSVCTVQFL